MERDDLIFAFEYLNRNRYFKLFDYYQAWFVNKNYLSQELSRKIKADLGIEVSKNSIHYIRNKIMPKRLAEKNKKVPAKMLQNEFNNADLLKESHQSSILDFEFHEPKSIDHNQNIVTFRKAKNETD